MRPAPIRTTTGNAVVIVLLSLALSGCGINSYSVAGVNAGLHASGSCSLLLESEIQIWSDFDGAVLPDVVGSDLISAAASDALVAAFQTRFARQLRGWRQISVDSEAMRREYLALYGLLADQALLLSNSPDPRWRHKRGRTDLGVGPGLLNLGSSSGCGSAVVLKGFQPPDSGAAVLPGAPVGRAVLTLGLLDLGSGEIIWINRIVLSVGHDLMRDRNLPAAIDRLLEDFPA